MNPLEALKILLFGQSERVQEDTPTGYRSYSVQTEPHILQRIFGGFTPPPTPTPTPRMPQPTATPTPTVLPTFDDRDPTGLQRQIEQGLPKAGFGDAPISTLTAQLAQAGSQLPRNVDPLLPTIIALMETGGGQNLSAQNNLFNIGPGINYPDPAVSILGGGPQNQLGLSGVLREGGIYDDFLQSGDLLDFFNRFTPSSDPLNPSQEELIRRYEILRSHFGG